MQRNHVLTTPPSRQADEASKKLVRVTHDALMAAIDACRPGARFRDLGDIISRHVANNGCGVCLQGRGGEGVGPVRAEGQAALWCARPTQPRPLRAASLS